MNTNNPSQRIYLDQAATSWPKPPAVATQMYEFMVRNGTSAGRGAYREGLEASRIVEQTRTKLRRLLGTATQDTVCFAYSGTDALNTAIHGLAQPGIHIITTEAEHNSVLRPITMLSKHRNTNVSVARVDGEGGVDPSEIEALTRTNTRWIIITHASNVTGTIQPIAEIAAIAKARAIRILVDAAQSLGHIPVDINDLGVDAVASSGHKGTLGPLGSGVLCLTEEVMPEIESLRQGGTGTASDSPYQPDVAPEKYEAGSLNVPGIAGWQAGIDYIIDNSEHIRPHEIHLCQKLLDGLRDISHVRIFGPSDAAKRTNAVAFQISGHDCHEVARVLEIGYNIQVRAGLHCAPLIHRALGAPEGTVRASVGPFTTETEIETLLRAVRDISSLSSFSP